MKAFLGLEEMALFGLSLWLFLWAGLAWWVFFALLLVPDVGMVGYLVNPRVGALTYNLTHHKGIAVGLYLLGVQFHVTWLVGAGLILLGHSSMDRLLGYGLKYPDSFHNTHLGKLGGRTQEAVQ